MVVSPFDTLACFDANCSRNKAFVRVAHGIKARKIKRIIGEIGIKAFRAYDKRMVELDFYTADDIEVILAHIK